MKNDEPMRNINPFGLRLQPDLKARLEEAAKQNKRSLNAEIAARLESSFGDALDAPPKLTFQIDKKKLLASSEFASALHDSVHDKVWRAIDEAIDEAINNSKKK